MSGWRDFWNRPNRIYVNERHLAVHYRQVADDIARALPRPGAVVLDYGCGEALSADDIGAGQLYLYDSAPATRARLSERHGGNPAITVLDETGLAGLPAASIDLLVVNSVLQYLARPELDALLGRARDWLRPDGRLLLADVIPPENAAAADALSLLRTSWRHGFFAAALAGLARTFFSDYRRIRQTLGLSTYTVQEIEAVAAEAGFKCAREPRNFGFNQRRMCFSLHHLGVGP